MMMASRLSQLRSKATELSQFMAKHGSVFYTEMMETNKKYVIDPLPTMGNCQKLSKQFFSTRIPGGETERFGFSRNQSSFQSMNFVQSILAEEDEQNSRKKKRDLVHFLLSRKKTFVTVTDANGNRKTGASAGCLEGKGRSRLSRYAAEATAEHVGRAARKMGLRSVIVKVKGSIFFRKKKKVILSFREGFRGEGISNQSPIMYIQDVTQLPHNGCRLPKKRRI